MFSQWVDYFYSAKKMYTVRTIFLEYLYSTQNICTDRGIFVHCEEYFYSAANICTYSVESMSKQWRSIFKSCGNMWTERRIFVQCGEYSYPGEKKKMSKFQRCRSCLLHCRMLLKAEDMFSRRCGDRF
jgi:hypothetical protein